MDAGDLGLLSIYSETQQCLRVHKRWLAKESASKELGINADLKISDAIFHTAKHLLTDTVDQIQAKRFDGDDDCLPEERKRHEKMRAQERLLDYMRMEDHFELTPSPLGIWVTWLYDAGWPYDTEPSIQIHSANCQYTKSFAVAKDAIEITTPCLSAHNGDDRMEIDGSRKNARVNCRSMIVRFGAGRAEFLGLSEGEQYFAMAYVISDPTSFIIRSQNTCKVLRKEAHAQPTPKAHNRTTGNHIVMGDDVYRLGARLNAVDIVKQRHWYNGLDSKGKETETVIGVPVDDSRGKPQTSKPSRKRPRYAAYVEDDET
ncbi:hypothetical protein F5B20DRAFT_519503 [Whalleya microplaca]|nr:hypothetical protein F5B20DRAFT_519503 [Whalleya microplaca]